MTLQGMRIFKPIIVLYFRVGRVVTLVLKNCIRLSPGHTKVESKPMTSTSPSIFGTWKILDNSFLVQNFCNVAKFSTNVPCPIDVRPSYTLATSASLRRASKSTSTAVMAASLSRALDRVSEVQFNAWSG